MVPTHLTSPKNHIVRSAVKLHRPRNRRATGQILLEGPNVVRAAIEAGHAPTALFVSEDHGSEHWLADVPDVYIVTDEILSTIGTTKSPRSPIGVFPRPDSEQIDPVGNLVVLVDIGDPGNVGTIVRTAAALGWNVAVTEHTADVWSPKVLRSAAGAHFQTTVTEVSLSDLESWEHATIATVPSGGEDYVATVGPVALLIGNETHGLPQNLIDRADDRLTIPMPGGTESLNAAVSAALGMWILRNDVES